MQGHLPVPSQPHVPNGLAPYVGYMATREPRPFDDRPPEEPGYGEVDPYELGVFADVGDWEPMHRALIKVVAVVVSISLLTAGAGAVVEAVLSAH